MKNIKALLGVIVLTVLITFVISSCMDTPVEENASSINSSPVSLQKAMVATQAWGTVYKPNGYTPWPGKTGDSVFVFKNDTLYGKSKINGSGGWSVIDSSKIWYTGNYVASTNILTDRFGTYKGTQAFYHIKDSSTHVNIILSYWNQ
jgi:hypothetical protein